MLVGAFILNLLPSSNTFVKQITNTPMKRLVSYVVLGTIVSGWVVAFMSTGQTPSLPVLNTAIALTIYATIVAVVYGGLGRMLSKTQARKLFIEA